MRVWGEFAKNVKVVVEITVSPETGVSRCEAKLSCHKHHGDMKTNSPSWEPLRERISEQKLLSYKRKHKTFLHSGR